MRRRLSPALLVLVVVAAACGADPADTEATGTPRSLAPAAEADGTVDESAAADAAAEDVEDDPSDDAQEVDPACARAEAVLLENVAESGAAPYDEQAARLLDAVAPLGTELLEAAEAVFLPTEGPLDPELGATIARMDDLMLEACGWPLWGATVGLVTFSAGERFCEVSAAIDGDEPEPQSEPCADSYTPPNSLPCFEPTGIDRELIAPGAIHWWPVDCETGVVVNWDTEVGAWVSDETERLVDPERPEWDFVSSGDPCTDLHTITVYPGIEQLSAADSEQEEAIMRPIFEAIDPSLSAILDAMAASDFDTPAEDLAGWVVLVDDVTNDACGFPYYGAFLAVVSATPAAKFCAVDQAIEDDVAENLDDDGCEIVQEAPPTHLPCFAPTGVDPVELVERGTHLWQPIDCDSGVEVEWDSQVHEWLPVS